MTRVIIRAYGNIRGDIFFLFPKRGRRDKALKVLLIIWCQDSQAEWELSGTETPHFSSTPLYKLTYIINIVSISFIEKETEARQRLVGGRGPVGFPGNEPTRRLCPHLKIQCSRFSSCFQSQPSSFYPVEQLPLHRKRERQRKGFLR